MKDEKSEVEEAQEAPLELDPCFATAHTDMDCIVFSTTSPQLAFQQTPTVAVSNKTEIFNLSVTHLLLLTICVCFRR
jgi:hypothetical protein